MKAMICNLKSICLYRYLVFAMLLIGARIYSQGYTISGRAFNEEFKKFGPVRVVLYDQSKKKLFEEETAGSGKFKLKNILNGKYTLNIYGEGGRGVTENITVKGADISDLEPTLNPNPDQVQLTIKTTPTGASINWKTAPDVKEFIIYRDNKEISTVSKTSFLDPVEPGKTYAYNIVTLKNDGSTGNRSITEYGKSSMP